MISTSLNFPATPYPTAGVLTALTRTDTGASVLSDGSLTGIGAAWTLTIAEPAPSLTYNYTVLFTFGSSGTAPASGTIVGTSTEGVIPTLTYDVVLDPSNPNPFNAPLVVPQSATPQIAWALTDVNLDPISLIGSHVEFVVWSSPENTLFEADSGTIGGIVISGTGSNVITLSLLTFDTAMILPDGANYTLWLNAPSQTVVIAQGAFSITPTQLLALVS